MNIDTQLFRESFKAIWQSHIESDSDDISKRFFDNTAWTSFMLGDDGMLKQIMASLNSQGYDLEYRREYYTIDALYVSGDNLFRENRIYPSRLQVLIEHENGGNVEEEMWKLIFWRSPLKIIIFYDFNEYEKIGSDAKGVWLKRKLDKLNSMLHQANSEFPENEKTEYLFIIGNREKEGEPPKWQWASSTQIEPTPL